MAKLHRQFFLDEQTRAELDHQAGLLGLDRNVFVQQIIEGRLGVDRPERPRLKVIEGGRDGR